MLSFFFFRTEVILGDRQNVEIQLLTYFLLLLLLLIFFLPLVLSVVRLLPLFLLGLAFLLVILVGVIVTFHSPLLLATRSQGRDKETESRIFFFLVPFLTCIFPYPQL